MGITAFILHGDLLLSAYAPEAKEIFQRLNNVQFELERHDLVYEVFLKYLDTAAGKTGSDSYKLAAQNIWETWVRFLNYEKS